MLLQLLASLIYVILRLPVVFAVLKDEVHISEELLVAGIHIGIHFALDGREIHGLGDFLEVVWDVVHDGVDGVLEGADQAGPES